MVFAEHGIVEVKIEDNILLVEATGPFNEELVQYYEQSLESCIKILEDSSWNQIIILHKLSMFTTEAEHKLVQTLKNRKERGLKASAVVLDNIEGESLVKTQMSRCYECANVDYKFTSSVHEAKQWLSMQ
tara:strand:+ start:7723 stop:8112 length:390 start_codon:yes stop_codon:yes gene_type:complete